MSEVKTNKISSLASNNDITLDPDGTGDVVVASGRLGIATSSPDSTLHVHGSFRQTGATAPFEWTVNAGAADTYKLNAVGYADNLLVATSTGNVGIGTSSPATTTHIQTSSGNPELRVESTGANYVTMSVKNSSRHYSTQIRTDQSNAYVIRDETAGANRFLIDTSGNVLAGTTNSTPGIGNNDGGIVLNSGNLLCVSRSGDTPVSINRSSSDGNLVDFRGGGAVEGTISMSGTTISYNGGHLSRWSQATDGNRIDGLVKGTVMTNLDQMAEWTKDGVTEDNEQLNCMAVSSVEGDANVAGVFVNWDEDDKYYTADMNIAMTGDMVIRIAQGTTVARGDLLMSAGDGTAKPQDDDIVRSKTIAKVTSTTKSHTYDDGSYLVPCVLMAC